MKFYSLKNRNLKMSSCACGCGINLLPHDQYVCMSCNMLFTYGCCYHVYREAHVYPMIATVCCFKCIWHQVK